MSENISLVIWMPAPNRHLDPLLDSLCARGLLEHVFLSRENLNWIQLGSRAANRPAALQTSIEPGARQRQLVAAAVAQHRESLHLIIGFADAICRSAMRECSRQSRRFFVWGESLRPRSLCDPRRIIRQTVYRTLVRRCAGAFALSPAAARGFHSLGIRSEHIYPALYPGPVARRTYKTPRHQRILYCGRLLRLKGFPELCTAVAALSSRRSGLCFDVLGKGPEGGHADKLAGSGVTVTMHGAVTTEKVRDVMATAAVVVLPTLTRDGWGYVVNESLSCAVPVVASTAVAAHELIAPGRTGYVFPAGSVDGLVTAIERALDLHERSETIADDFLTAQKGFEPEAFVEYLRAVLVRGEMSMFANTPPPWHVTVEAMGGNPETAWWNDWHGRTKSAGTA